MTDDRSATTALADDHQHLARRVGPGRPGLVLTGIATSGVVLSTVRAAADLDFWLTVLSGCCLDADPQVHEVLTEKVFPRQALVLTESQWQRDQQLTSLGEVPG